MFQVTVDMFVLHGHGMNPGTGPMAVKYEKINNPLHIRGFGTFGQM